MNLAEITIEISLTRPQSIPGLELTSMKLLIDSDSENYRKLTELMELLYRDSQATVASLHEG